MCARNFILHWCPCEDHAREMSLGADKDSQKHFPLAEVEGHTIVKRTFTRSYTWCDEYCNQPSFINTFFRKPPKCPKGPCGEDFLHFRATELCEACQSIGCPAPNLNRPPRTECRFQHELKDARRETRKARHAARHAAVEPSVLPTSPIRPLAPTRPVAARIPLLSDSPLRTIDLKALDKYESERLKIDAERKAKRTARKERKKPGNTPAAEENANTAPQPQLTRIERWLEGIHRLQAYFEGRRKELSAELTTALEDTSDGNEELDPAEGTPRRSEEDDTASIRTVVFNPKG
ncbi:uncharacterized protein C8A04DRAFT_24618 [Dichotomopilus funicola]|uniref:Uncharacterized protein n=1 Tax=Dichotomopilus funicola TaxID=1934379 RepID=A0AAN6VC57_9PEZI|nr:hypothetical protein C8A04DRAFT_24618 [Dichotomopilus funicola]